MMFSIFQEPLPERRMRTQRGLKCGSIFLKRSIPLTELSWLRRRRRNTFTTGKARCWKLNVRKKGTAFFRYIIRDRQAPPLCFSSLSIVDSPFDYRAIFSSFIFVFHSWSVPTAQFDTALSRGDIDLLIGVRKKNRTATFAPSRRTAEIFSKIAHCTAPRTSLNSSILTNSLFPAIKTSIQNPIMFQTSEHDRRRKECCSWTSRIAMHCNRVGTSRLSEEVAGDQNPQRSRYLAPSCNEWGKCNFHSWPIIY